MHPRSGPTPHSVQYRVMKKKNASKCNICLDESGLKFKFSLYSTSSKQSDQTVRSEPAVTDQNLWPRDRWKKGTERYTRHAVVVYQCTVAEREECGVWAVWACSRITKREDVCLLNPNMYSSWVSHFFSDTCTRRGWVTCNLPHLSHVLFLCPSCPVLCCLWPPSLPLSPSPAPLLPSSDSEQS